MEWAWGAPCRTVKWHEQWADIANEHLQRTGREVRIDHRTLEAPGINLVSGRKVCVPAERRFQDDVTYLRTFEAVVSSWFNGTTGNQRIRP
jgi:hypothetical protein